MTCNFIEIMHPEIEIGKVTVPKISGGESLAHNTMKFRALSLFLYCIGKVSKKVLDIKFRSAPESIFANVLDVPIPIGITLPPKGKDSFKPLLSCFCAKSSSSMFSRGEGSPEDSRWSQGSRSQAWSRSVSLLLGFPGTVAWAIWIPETLLPGKTSSMAIRALVCSLTSHRFKPVVKVNN